MIDEKKLIEDLKKNNFDVLMSDAECFGLEECTENIIQLINEQQKVGDWIPVEDRMPECTRKTIDGQMSSDVVLVTTVDDYGFITSSVDFLIGNMWAAKMPNEKVIAWQPLPEPYKGE